MPAGRSSPVTAPNWRETYARERAKRVARIRADQMLEGGQGRTAESIQRDSAGVVWALACLALLLVLLVASSGK
jgi:hypothetical protein